MSKRDEFLPESYDPCPCGSGKKYKFCCRLKDKANLNDASQDNWLANMGRDEPFRETGEEIVILSGPNGKLIPPDVRKKTDIINRLNALPPNVHREALAYFNKGLDALDRFDLDEAIHYSTEAIALAGFYPPPYNNRALALFFKWRIKEAIRDALTVKEKLDPFNVPAVVNLIRFYQMLNNQERVKFYGAELERLNLKLGDYETKALEGYALLENDDKIIALTEPLLKKYMTYHVWVFRAVALANKGEFQTALDLLKQYLRKHSDKDAKQLYNDMQTQQENRKFRKRFPYLTLPNLFPRVFIEKFSDELTSTQNNKLFDAKIKRFAANEPAMGIFGRYMMWYDDKNYLMGVSMLEAVNNKWAVEELKKFAFSDYCSMEARMEALYALHRLKILKSDELIRFWQDGEWKDIKIFGTEVTDEVLLDYPTEFLEADEKVQALVKANKDIEAEKAYLEIIKKWPRIARGYANLASIYLSRDDYKQGRIYMEKAHEIDPKYPFAVCGLARLELVEGNLEQATKILGKMAEIRKIHPEAMILWWFTDAQLSLAKNEIEKAEKHLEQIRKIDPRGHYTNMLEKQIDSAKRINQNPPYQI